MYDVHLIFNLFSLLVKKNRYNDNDCHLKTSFAVTIVALMTVINYRALTLVGKTSRQMNTHLGLEVKGADKRKY